MNKMKLLAGVSLGIFAVIGSSLILAGFWNRNFPTAGNGDAPDETITSKTEEKVLTAEEVAKHTSPNDCWMIISGSVYNLTSFISAHPGGADMVVPYCGKDGTAGFLSKERLPSLEHSAIAKDMLANYFVGKLGSIQTNEVTALVSTGVPAIPTLTPLPTVTPISVTASVNLTAAETAKHNTAGDCWLIISGKVYNVSGYIRSHPGGSAVIINECGKDATTAFASQGGKGSHSGFANSLLANYFVGNMNTSVSTALATSAALTGTTVTGSAASSVSTAGSTGMPAAIVAKYPGSTVISGKYEDSNEWEGKVSVSGACRSIKVSESGNITQDEPC